MQTAHLSPSLAYLLLMCFNDFFNFYAFTSGKVTHKLKTTAHISCILAACQTLFWVSSMLIQRISKPQIPLASLCSKWGNRGKQQVSHAQEHRTRRQERMTGLWICGFRVPSMSIFALQWRAERGEQTVADTLRCWVNMKGSELLSINPGWSWGSQ